MDEHVPESMTPRAVMTHRFAVFEAETWRRPKYVRQWVDHLILGLNTPNRPRALGGWLMDAPARDLADSHLLGLMQAQVIAPVSTSTVPDTETMINLGRGGLDLFRKMASTGPDFELAQRLLAWARPRYVADLRGVQYRPTLFCWAPGPVLVTGAQLGGHGEGSAHKQ